MIVRFKKLSAEVPTPAYAHLGDAGCDLCAAEDASLAPGERKMVSTGIAVSIPEGYAGFLQPRSGLAAKKGVSIVNTPGLIDSHYRGEIKAILINHDPNATFTVTKGDRICQLVIQRVESVDFEEVDELDETQRGEGGFGSTGV